MDCSHRCNEQSWLSTVSSFRYAAAFTLIPWIQCLRDILGDGAKFCNTGATRSFLTELRGLNRLSLAVISLTYTT